MVGRNGTGRPGRIGQLMQRINEIRAEFHHRLCEELLTAIDRCLENPHDRPHMSRIDTLAAGAHATDSLTPSSTAEPFEELNPRVLGS